jgi:hypothetical protein
LQGHTSCTMASSAALSSSVQEPVAEDAPVPPPSPVPALWPLVASLLVPVHAELAALRATSCWCSSRSCNVGDFGLPTPPAEWNHGVSGSAPPHQAARRASEHPCA